MNSTQEFLVLEAGSDRFVYGVGDLPRGTVVGGDAKRLRVVGHAWVELPQTQFTIEQLEDWKRRLREAGYKTEDEPFWR